MHRFVTMQKKHGILTSRIRGWGATSSLVQVFQIRVHIVQRPGSCLVIINIIINVKIRIFRGTINLLATPFPPPSHLYFELWSSFLWRIIIAWKCNRAWKENDDQIGSCFLQTPSHTSKPEFTNPSSFFSLCNIVYTLYNYDNLHFRMFACRCLWSDPCRRTSPVSKHKMTIAL
jgi:hypothetical protein